MRQHVMTMEQFRDKVGRWPTEEELKQVNCEWPGMSDFHSLCGVCRHGWPNSLTCRECLKEAAMEGAGRGYTSGRDFADEAERISDKAMCGGSASEAAGNERADLKPLQARPRSLRDQIRSENAIRSARTEREVAFASRLTPEIEDIFSLFLEGVRLGFIDLGPALSDNALHRTAKIERAVLR